MVLRHRITPPRDIFPVDPWAVETRAYIGQYLREAETIFSLANGYIGLRGSHEEDYPVGEPGTYVNGFHELRDIIYGEDAYGFPRTGQTMLNCPDGKIIKLFVDDEPFDIDTREVVSYQRRLDFRRAALERRVVWRTPNGKLVELKTERLVSLTHRHLAAIHYEVTVQDAEADIVIRSELVNRQAISEASRDPRLSHAFQDRVLTPVDRDLNGLRAILCFETSRSGMGLGCGIDHSIETDCHYSAESMGDEDTAAFVFKVKAHPGEPIRISKYLSYHHSAYRPSEDLKDQVGWTLDRALEAGFSEILGEQARAVEQFWANADVTLEDGEDKQQVIRWDLFQLLQASWAVEGNGIGARALTGQSYEGHYFWDTEVYVLPFLIYTNPRVARSLLKFRYDKLDKARKRARELGHRGALFPWRTINGDEASAYYAASTAQYHINADIAYAIRKYVDVTGDREFLERYGAEILVETARLWEDLGYFNERLEGRFCISGVTGPDEYTTVVNNNYFTNIMARENLSFAAKTLRDMDREAPEVFAAVARMTALQDGEIDAWEAAAARVYLPYDEELGVNPQDDSFLSKEVWDFENTPEGKFPLMLHFHPLNLYRHQVLKQADTLLAMFLLGHEFSRDQKKRNFDYYDPITTHDSSLSVCIQSIIANEIGYADKALDYFSFAAMMDLSDVGGNVKHGAHIASIGGSWMALVYGFAGMRDFGGDISFEPRVPESWGRLAFRLQIRGATLQVEARPASTSYSLVAGERVELIHCGHPVILTPKEPALTLDNSRAAMDQYGEEQRSTA